MTGLADQIAELVQRALDEDLGAGDVTAEATVPAAARATGRILRKQPGVIFGLAPAVEAFRRTGAERIEAVAPESGWSDKVPEEVLRVEGPARALLAGERVALNFLGHLSGIATLTARYVQAVSGTGARILDTRKTTPGLRALEKAAVVAGGGVNHRFGLYDAILVKENHIAMAGGVGAAIEACRDSRPDLKVEVETETLEQVKEAIALRPDRIMLDDMEPAALAAAVALRNGNAPGIELEVSGGVNLANVREIAATGVDFISVGALTHSAPQLDLSMLVSPASG